MNLITSSYGCPKKIFHTPVIISQTPRFMER
jgi:hypothetical protein